MEGAVFIVIPYDNLTLEDVSGVRYSTVMHWYESGKIDWYIESSKEIHPGPENSMQLKLESSFSIL